MSIEESVFKKCHVQFEQLESYGFTKINGDYLYAQTFFHDQFQARITINQKGHVQGQVLDLNTHEEYIHFRLDGVSGEFVNQVKEAYLEILTDIKKHCFILDPFHSPQANRITCTIKERYSVGPEFLWEKFNGHGVFRYKENQKWFAIIMSVDRSKIDEGEGEIEIIDVKAKEETIQQKITENGFYPGYHMNKKSWLTLLLDDTLSDECILQFLHESYQLVQQSKK